MDTPQKKVTGYGMLIKMNGVPVLCIVQEQVLPAAILAFLQSGREKVAAKHIRRVTVVPGHRFPTASEFLLTECPTADDFDMEMKFFTKN